MTSVDVHNEEKRGCSLPNCDQLNHDDDYLRDALSLGDKRAVVASCAIYSTTNIKLVIQGARVNSKLFEKLIQHKLAPPIDECLSVEGAVDAAQLRTLVNVRLMDDARFGRVTQSISIKAVLKAFQEMPMPAPLAFKLSLARENRSHLFDHCLDVAIMAVYLRASSAWKDSDLSTAAAAGMYHDLGILHIPEHVLGSGKPLTESDRRYLYSHPVTSALIAQQYLPLMPEIGIGISEHHERTDGSGYPKGLIQDQISELGKLLMMADSSIALLGTSHVLGSVSLRLLRRKFDPYLLESAHKLFTPFDSSPSAYDAPHHVQLILKLQSISEIFSAWEKACQSAMNTSSCSGRGALMSLIDDRIVALERTLLESGFVFGQIAEFSEIAEQDQSSAIETFELASETIWQIRDITLEARRRWTEMVHEELDLDLILGWISFAEEKIACLTSGR